MAVKSILRIPGKASLIRLTLALVPILALLGALQACGDGGGTGPETSTLEIVVLGGANQSAGPESLLPDPLRVRVQTLSNGSVREDVRVRWEVLEGSGAKLDPTSSLTDSAGVAETRLTLGPGLGEYRIRASVPGMVSPPAEFSSEAILDPDLTLAPAGPVVAGGTIRLEGRNFSRDPDGNVVTFSGIRGRVIEASASDLRVQVPECLPDRNVSLVVRVGSLSTPPRPLEVQGGSEFLELAVGEDRILEASQALGCFRLPSDPGSRFLAVAHSTGIVGGAEYPVQLVGLTQDGVEPVGGSPASPRPLVPREASHIHPSGPVPEDHWTWESALRAMEREWLGEMIRQQTDEPSVPGSPSRADEPQVGDTREFKVLNSDKAFDRVTARVRYLTEHSVVYVDEETPPGGFDDEDFAFFAGQFEDPIHPTVTGIFGGESDLDQNGRVIILFTPGVNRLTPEGSDGYVGGFFFGVDLQEDHSGSNKGEIFYAVVPDPSGIHGPVLNRTPLMSALPAILAHEFEHMVHFNQRILEGGARSQDALWLSEALAQMAEDLVGEAFREKGDPVRAMDYQLGNWGRARRFLQNPSQVSVLTTLPPGTLAERGAAWLLLKHLYGRDGAEELIRTLTGSYRTGVENVTHASGRNWEDIVTDWAGSLYLDGLAVPVRIGLRVLGVNLRDALSRAEGDYPLDPVELGGSTFSFMGSLWSSAPEYFILTPPAAGGLAVNLSGPEGRPGSPAAGLRVLVVRLQ